MCGVCTVHYFHVKKQVNTLLSRSLFWRWGEVESGPVEYRYRQVLPYDTCTTVVLWARTRYVADVWGQRVYEKHPESGGGCCSHMSFSHIFGVQIIGDTDVVPCRYLPIRVVSVFTFSQVHNTNAINWLTSW